jgi:heptosyltransferase-2
LARRLADEGYAAWLLGGPGDRPIGAAVMSEAGGAAIDLTGRTTLEDAVDLIAAAAGVVSNDSGLMHVAAALGRPLVALYGSSSPAFTPPLSDRAVILSEEIACSPCFERVCPLGHFKCLTDLQPERVWVGLRGLLAKA